MDIKRLKHLVALADERNFGRAAERVHLSQPAFSRSVQNAETELGLQLFDRGSLEVSCTSAGSFVIERARKLLFDSRCLERDVGLYRERLIGDIAFGVGPFPAATLLPALMIELRTRYAGINSRVEVNNWWYLVEHLRAEELDFFLADIRDVPRDADLMINSLGQQHAQFYVRTGHPLLAQPSIQAPEMVVYGLASVRVPEEIKRLLRQLLGLKLDDHLPISVECDDVHLLKHVALHSNTVLASTDAAVREELVAGLLQALVVKNMPPMYTDMGIVSLTGRSFSPMATFAVDFLRVFSASMVAS
jgi:DNA-binding transcriptional LysR family regulator